jgi:hypothetical protein
VAVATADELPDAVAFASPATYDESQVAKIAPAVLPSGCLAVSAENGLRIWGISPSQPMPATVSLSAQILDPGIVQVGVGVLTRYAVLTGRECQIAGAYRDSFADFLARLLRPLSETETSVHLLYWRAIADLVRMIVADGHGGTVLIVPAATGARSQSLSPFDGRFKTSDATLNTAIRREVEAPTNLSQELMKLEQGDRSDEQVTRLMVAIQSQSKGVGGRIRALASLAKVDGAVVLTRDLHVEGFGAKIDVNRRESEPLRLHMLQPVRGQDATEEAPLERLGGTRHQSAARFVNANRDSVAIVVSQDRHVSVMWFKDEVVAVLRNAEWWL